jgi:pimeloyl-ACP methyl ester carboxylesterase
LDDLRIEPAVAILIHGFNVNRADGKKRLQKLAAMLPSATGIVSVLWPGDHWSGPLSYSFEGRDADDTAVELARFLDDTLNPQSEISFVAHSLGCRVTMATIELLRSMGRSVSQVCLMAPAIDDDSLSGPGQYLSATKSVQRVAVMSSRKDRVLRYSYPAGDLLQAFLFFDESGDLALGYHGPRKHKHSGTSIPANILDLRIPRNKKVKHGDYVPMVSPNKKQKAAVKFANAVIAGEAEPVYP